MTVNSHGWQALDSDVADLMKPILLLLYITRKRLHGAV